MGIFRRQSFEKLFSRGKFRGINRTKNGLSVSVCFDGHTFDENRQMAARTPRAFSFLMPDFELTHFLQKKSTEVVHSYKYNIICILFA
jgi:hypothetical protein